MGTINYGTSDFITLGIKPYYDFDEDLLNELKEESEEYGMTQEETLEDYISTLYEADMENAKSILEKYSLYYFHIELKPGYHEGMYIDIEPNFGVFYEDYEERQEAQKEITQIKKLLLELADVGFVACLPGWCTRYMNHEETVKAIKEAVKEMREQAKLTPTFLQFDRECA